MNDVYFNKIVTGVLIFFLAVVSFLVLKPILMAIITALIFAFVFSPIYKWLYKKTGLRNTSVGIIMIFLMAIIFLPIWFLTPVLLKQSFSIFQYTQQIDFVKPLQSIFPHSFSSQQFSSEIGSIFSSFTSRVANSFSTYISDFVLHFPTMVLQSLVVLFTFFYVLRDGDHVMEYVKSILPFPQSIQKKIFEYSEGITASVLYGQVIIGTVQGIITGIGFYLFGVHNALFLTLLAVVAGIFPIIGTAVVWIPVTIYLFFSGSVGAGWGVVAFGLLSSVVENFLRPLIVSRRTKIHSGLLLVSMIGGVFFFGVLGFILGPLAISYLLILLEIYRGKKISGIISEED